MTKLKSVGVSLPNKTIAALDALALNRGISRGEVIRQCVELALPFIAIRSKIDVWRVVANIEYLSLFADAVLTRDHPDLADSLPDLTMKRMGEFHA